jgi:hypothetical protein
LTGGILPGCQEDRVEFPIEPDAVADVNPDVAGDATSDADGDAEVTGPQNPVGRACVSDDDCEGFTCIDDTLLAAFGSTDLSVPNGMCSSLLCDDSTCGEGATCVDLEPAFGASVKICLKLCDELAACRWEEAYSCAQPIADDPRFVCLPDNIIVAIECDDGHCEPGAAQ